MREKRTGEKSAKTTTDWRRLRFLSDRQIRRSLDADPEARATDAEFWKKARVVLPRPKQAITIRLDADLLQWFRRQRGYQTRINAVLRSYMHAQVDRTGSAPGTVVYQGVWRKAHGTWP